MRMSLLGRADECALLDGLIDDIRRGESRSLVLRGEAGIGKTALLEYLVESASDLTVVRAVGVESEMELAFASLHQLCAPLLDRLERLPAPQRDALRIVFGLTAGAAAGSLPGRPRRAQPGVRGGRAASAAVRRRRRAVARSDLGADARVRRSPAAGRAGRARVRGTRARRGAPAPAGARGARPRQRRRPRAAELGGAVRAGRAGARPDHRRDAGQPARAARAAARADADAAGRRLRAAGRAAISRDGSRRATSGDSRPSPTTRGVCCSSPRPSRSAIRCSCGARASASGSRPSAVDATDGLLALEERVTFRHPAGALGRVPVRRRRRSAGRPTWRWRR